MIRKPIPHHVPTNNPNTMNLQEDTGVVLYLCQRSPPPPDYVNRYILRSPIIIDLCQGIRGPIHPKSPLVVSPIARTDIFLLLNSWIPNFLASFFYCSVPEMPLDPDRLILMSTESVTNWSIESPTILHLFDHSIPDEPLLRLFGKSDVDTAEPGVLEETFNYHVSNGNNKHVIYKTRIKSVEAMKQYSVRLTNQHKNKQDHSSHFSDKRVVLDCNSYLVDSLKLFKQTVRTTLPRDKSCIGPLTSNGYSQLRVESRPR